MKQKSHNKTTVAATTPWPPGPWPAAWRAWLAGDGPRQRRVRAARRPGEPCGPEARGGGARARTGAARGVLQRHSPATTAARQRSDGGGAGIGQERGQGGIGEHEEAN